MIQNLKLSPKLYFSYGQFHVYDSSVKAPGCIWCAEHFAQGFARRESTVCFRTLLEYGFADVYCKDIAFLQTGKYERAIGVPFLVTSGRVIIDGPEEINIERELCIPVGNYRIVAAQCIVGEDEESVDLFFEFLHEPLSKSEIIVSDLGLSPPLHLLETANAA
jgi:hypothetical protein